jgi:hypothetical protein
MERKEADQRFLSSLIQRTSRNELSWHCEQEDGIDPHSYFCMYPTRVQIGSDSKNLRAIDIFLYPDYLIAIDAWEKENARSTREALPVPILHFTRIDYPTQFDRLTVLAEAQRIEKRDEAYVALMSGFLKGQN